MAIGAKLGKFMDKVILIPRRPLTGSNHSDGKYACLCPIQWLAIDARSDIQTINFPIEGE
jgi:hypothetical protein